VMDIVEKAIIAMYKKMSELHPETARWPIDFDEEEQREEREIMASVIKDSLSTCKRSLQLADSLTEFMEWTEALAIVGSVTPEAWDLLNKITRKAEKRLFEGKEEWKCPIGKTDCNENCGSYGCGN